MSKYSNITIAKATSIIDEKIEEKVIDISIQVETLPTITTTNLGKIYQYVGETTTDYTKGYFYEAKNTGTAEAPTYSWVQVNIGGGDTTAIEEAIGKDAKGNLVKVTDRIKDEAVDAIYLIKPVGDYEEDMIPTEDWINYASARAKVLRWMIETEEGAKISSNDIFISDSGEPSCNGYTFTYDADTDVYICTALNCKIAPTEKRLYNTSETYVVELYTYFETTGQTIKEKIESIEVIANPTEEATETLSKVKIDSTVYSVSGGGSSSVKIYDNDDDTTTEGKLWNCTDGKLVIDNLTANYSELEIYYSQKDTSEIQYYKINTELITLPKTNKGMFYVFDPTVDIYRMEPVTVEYNLKEDAAEGDKKAITITSTAGENSEVKIERVYGKE